MLPYQTDLNKSHKKNRFGRHNNTRANNPIMNKLFPLFLFCLFTIPVIGQDIQKDSSITGKASRFKYESLIIPVSLITYGIIGLESHTITGLNQSTRVEIREHIDERFSIDDFSQYSTFMAVYGLNALGVKGKHNLADRTLVLGTAYAIMGLTVNIIKRTGRVERPDGTSKNSFPSGHTATAFMGAEFLYQEYKSKSVWYGIAGYAVAAGTGYFRMYNDRHWLTDIATGAGIGILSTKFAYLVYPYLKKKIFKGKLNKYGVILPYTNGSSYRMKMAVQF